MVLHQFPDTKHFHIEHLGDGIYAAIASREGGAICNSGIVDLGDNLVIFDTFLTPESSQILKNSIEKTLEKPVGYVINSHYHSDHIRGNQVYTSTANIIATNACRKLIATKGVADIKWDKEQAEIELELLKAQYKIETELDKKQEIDFWIAYFQSIQKSLPGLKLSLPNLTFEKKLTLIGKKRSVEIINTGGGHTTNDSVLYIPEEKILFTGDLISVNHHPYLANSNPEIWLQTLYELKKFDINKLIPGHGPVGNKSSIDKIIQYITDLERIAKSIKHETISMQNKIIQDVPPPYHMWHYKHRFYEKSIRYLLDL